MFRNFKAMKAGKFHIVLILVISFFWIQLSEFLDDPEHLLVPDPDCPICKMVNSLYFPDSDTPTDPAQYIIIYLPEISPPNQVFYCFKSLFSIRAPPSRQVFFTI